ncbi:putative endoglucanase precursor, partial [Conidiobolus coronatus NRRL 28638]
SHMLLHTPPARWSKFNPEYVKAGKVDDNLHSPLGEPLGTRLPFPCGRAKGPSGATLKAGQSVKWSLYGGATHNGGHCEISLSYDDKTFVSIQTILGNCMKDGKLDYEVTIPANAPSGPATFAWTWINWSGNREYYMNCADVDIEGNPNGVLTGPKIVEANMPGRPTIPEFQGPNTGAQL